MNEEPLDLHRFGRAISRGRWVVIAFVIGGIVAAALFTAVRLPRHYASTVVLLPPAPQTSSGQPARDIQTEVEVATSAVVLQLASQALPSHPSIHELKREVTVGGPTPDVLVFKGHAPSAHDAIAVSNAAANAYVSYSKTSASDQAQQVIAPLNKSITELVTTNLDLQKKINQALSQENTLDPRSQEYLSLSSQVTQWQNQLQSGGQELQADRNLIATAQATNTANNAINVISPASAATNNLLQATGLNLLAGALLGLLLGTTLVIARDSRRRRPWRRSDISATAGVPVLASLAARSVGKPSEWFALLDDYEPSPDEQWGLRKLLRSIVTADSSAPANATVLSLASDEAALAIAPQLASFAAGSGLRTVLILGRTARSVRALRQVRDVAALSGVAPRENLSLVEEMPAETGDDVPPVDLIVRMVVTDRAGFELEDMDGATMLFAVSPGAATPEQFQAVADAAFNANAPLAGIVVASPEVYDTSAGTVPEPASTSAAEPAIRSRWLGHPSRENPKTGSA
jgi:capsular polysaccharide biosynthesis protein